MVINDKNVIQKKKKNEDSDWFKSKESIIVDQKTKTKNNQTDRQSERNKISICWILLFYRQCCILIVTNCYIILMMMIIMMVVLPFDNEKKSLHRLHHHQCLVVKQKNKKKIFILSASQPAS